MKKFKIVKKKKGSREVTNLRIGLQQGEGGLKRNSYNFLKDLLSTL